MLDLLVIAAPQRVTNFTQPGFTPVGWAYEVCMRPDAGNACPPGTTGLYGGFRLGLQPGDLLKMRLVNQLPPVKPATLASYVYDPLLALNPTNLHVHGLVVEATANSVAPPTVPVYGDFIFTSVFNPANGNPANYSLVPTTNCINTSTSLPTVSWIIIFNCPPIIRPGRIGCTRTCMATP